MTATQPNQPARYIENRAVPLVSNAKQYMCAIIQASIEGNKMPVFSPSIDFTQRNPNQTTYALNLNLSMDITLQTAGKDDQQFSFSNNASITPLVYFNNSGVSAPVNMPSNWTNVMDNPYYYCYSIDDFIQMFNNALSSTNSIDALQSALNAYLDTNYSTYPTPDLSTGFPIPDIALSFSPASNLFSITAPTSTTTGAGDTWSTTFSSGVVSFTYTFDNIKCNLCFNEDLWTLVGKFPYDYVSANKPCPYQLRWSSAPVSGLNLTLSQETTSLSAGWCPVSSVVFIANIGVKPEQVGNTLQLSSNTNFGSPSNNQENQITDILLNYTNPMDINSLIDYVPTNNRELNIYSDDVRYIDISIYWKDKYGGYHPFLLDTGCSVKLKMMFYR